MTNERWVRLAACLFGLCFACEVGDSDEAGGRADLLPYSDYLGCFADDADRALPDGPTVRDDMTPDVCIELCEAFSYRYAGVQFFGECWCGNEVRYEQRPEQECDTPCNGDPGVACGGAWRNSVYAVRGAPPSGDECNFERSFCDGNTLVSCNTLAQPHELRRTDCGLLGRTCLQFSGGGAFCNI